MRNCHLHYLLGWSMALLLASAGVAGAESTDRSPVAKLARVDGQPELLKATSDLLSIRSDLAAGRVMSGALSRFPRITARDGRVLVEVRLLEPPSNSRVEALRGSNLEITEVFTDLHSVLGWIAPGDLHRLASDTDVRVIRPVYPPIAMAGATSSQGDASIRADLARSTFSIDGSGVTVGVVSDSFASTPSVGGSLQPSNPAVCPAPISSDHLSGSLGQASGDLPGAIHVLDDCDSITANCAAVRDEGAAIGEIVHDLAPGAQLLFHSGFNSRQNFAEGIDELTACGADVIVDDVMYLVEPMFQDGFVAQAAERAADSGVAYFTAAGNQASFGIDETFDDFAGADEEEDEPSGIDFHHFAGSPDPFAAVTVPAGCGITAVLQWNQPFDVPLGPGAETDLDLYICEGEGGGAPDLPPFHPSDDPCLFYSQNAQGCGAGAIGTGLGDPVEIVDYLNPGPGAKTVYLAVDHYCGDTDGDFQEDDSVRFRIVTFGLNCNLSDPGYQFETGIFDRSQIYGHPAAASANAITSVFYDEIDSDGTTDLPLDQIDVEPFSSSGGSVAIYFDDVGSPLPGGPEIRTKPELAAPDGVNTTFFGTDIAEDADTYPNFFGSSAAAPHAAALAALMLEANPHLTSTNLVEILKTTARDIESAGWDTESGHGLIDAVDALSLSRPDSTVGPSSYQFGVVGVGDTVSKIFTLTNVTPGPAALWVSSIDLSDESNFGIDPSQGPQPCGSETPTLDPAQSCSFEITFSPGATGPYSESVEIQSNGPSVEISLQGSSIDPSLFVSGSASPTTVSEPGGTSTVTVQIRNDSATTDPVSLTSLSDTLLGNLAGTGTCVLPQLIPAGTTYQCSYSVSVGGNAGTIVGRQVTATGQDDDGDGVSGDFSASVTVTDALPNVSVSLSADPPVIDEPGGLVTFHLEVENTSSVTDPVTIDSIQDDVAGDVTDGSNPMIQGSTCQTDQLVGPGETYSCSYTSEVSGLPGRALVHQVEVLVRDDEGSDGADQDSASVTIQAVGLFDDGFESGDLSAWSSSVP